MTSINMRSSALSIKAQGVGSCFSEQLRLVTGGLADKYEIRVNSARGGDIAHYHTVNLSYFFERLFFRYRSAGICYVHFLPETVDESLRLPALFRRVFYRYLLAFYNSMDYLVVVNPVVTGQLAAHGVTRPRIVYIPNYVSDADFHPETPETREALRSQLGFSASDFVVLGAGQLQTRKGIFDFVETARRLPEVKFIWAGGFSFGKLTDGYDEISELAGSLPDNVRFLGIVEREKMAGLYNAADLFFLPSFNELFPMTVLEAAACGAPILLRELELYKGILAGYYISGSDARSFAEVIAALRSDPAARGALAEKALECHRAYSEDAVLQMWERLYAEVCALKRERGVTAAGTIPADGR